MSEGSGYFHPNKTKIIARQSGGVGRAGCQVLVATGGCVGRHSQTGARMGLTVDPARCDYQLLRRRERMRLTHNNYARYENINLPQHRPRRRTEEGSFVVTYVVGVRALKGLGATDMTFHMYTAATAICCFYCCCRVAVARENLVRAVAATAAVLLLRLVECSRVAGHNFTNKRTNIVF